MRSSVFTRLALAAATLATPLMVGAESQLTIGTGSAAANLDVRVIIPRVLYLAVGTGNATIATNNTVDRVIFDYSTNATDVGGGATLPAASITPAGGAVAVRVFGNSGVITVTSTTTAATLVNGTGDTIAWSEITATSSDATNFPVPAATGAAVALAVSSGTKVTNRTATWTYAYANSAIVAPGTYDGRITYTATMP